MKIDKTEKEFRESLYQKLEQGQYVTHPLQDFRVPYFRAVVDLLALEFREEEPELPERVEVRPPVPGMARPFLGVEHQVDNNAVAWRITREAARRYNDFPALEGLARELAEISNCNIDVGAVKWLREFRDRARELLGKEGR